MGDTLTTLLQRPAMELEIDVQIALAPAYLCSWGQTWVDAGAEGSARDKHAECTPAVRSSVLHGRSHFAVATSSSSRRSVRGQGPGQGSPVSRDVDKQTHVRLTTCPASSTITPSSISSSVLHFYVSPVQHRDTRIAQLNKSPYSMTQLGASATSSSVPQASGEEHAKLASWVLVKRTGRFYWSQGTRWWG